MEPLFLEQSHIASATVRDIHKSQDSDLLTLEIRGRTADGRLLTRGTAKMTMPNLPWDGDGKRG